MARYTCRFSIPDDHGKVRKPLCDLMKACNMEIIYEIEKMSDEGRIPPVPVFLDSPLAINVTSLYQKYLGYFNDSSQKQAIVSHGLFNFPQLQLTLKTDASRAISAPV